MDCQATTNGMPPVLNSATNFATEPDVDKSALGSAPNANDGNLDPVVKVKKRSNRYNMASSEPEQKKIKEEHSYLSKEFQCQVCKDFSNAIPGKIQLPCSYCGASFEPTPISDNTNRQKSIILSKQKGWFVRSRQEESAQYSPGTDFSEPVLTLRSTNKHLPASRDSDKVLRTCTPNISDNLPTSRPNISDDLTTSRSNMSDDLTTSRPNTSHNLPVSRPNTTEKLPPNGPKTDDKTTSPKQNSNKILPARTPSTSKPSPPVTNRDKALQVTGPSSCESTIPASRSVLKILPKGDTNHNILLKSTRDKILPAKNSSTAGAESNASGAKEKTTSTPALLQRKDGSMITHKTDNVGMLTIAQQACNFLYNEQCRKRTPDNKLPQEQKFSQQDVPYIDNLKQTVLNNLLPVGKTTNAQRRIAPTPKLTTSQTPPPTLVPTAVVEGPDGTKNIVFVVRNQVTTNVGVPSTAAETQGKFPQMMVLPVRVNNQLLGKTLNGISGTDTPQSMASQYDKKSLSMDITVHEKQTLQLNTRENVKSVYRGAPNIVITDHRQPSFRPTCLNCLQLLATCKCAQKTINDESNNVPLAPSLPKINRVPTVPGLPQKLSDDAPLDKPVQVKLQPVEDPEVIYENLHIECEVDDNYEIPTIFD